MVVVVVVEDEDEDEDDEDDEEEAGADKQLMGVAGLAQELIGERRHSEDLTECWDWHTRRNRTQRRC